MYMYSTYTEICIAYVHSMPQVLLVFYAIGSAFADAAILYSYTHVQRPSAETSLVLSVFSQ